MADTREKTALGPFTAQHQTEERLVESDDSAAHAGRVRDRTRDAHIISMKRFIVTSEKISAKRARSAAWRWKRWLLGKDFYVATSHVPS